MVVRPFLTLNFVTQTLLILLLLVIPVSAAFVAPSIKIERHYSLSPLKMSSLQEIEVITDPGKDFLEKKGVFQWGTWGCGVSKFPWTYSEAESCYLLQGKVIVTPNGGGQPVRIQAGNFVTFPAGMSCTWDVQEAVEKHYMFF